MRVASGGGAATSGGAGIDGVDELALVSAACLLEEHPAAIAMTRQRSVAVLAEVRMRHYCGFSLVEPISNQQSEISNSSRVRL